MRFITSTWTDQEDSVSGCRFRYAFLHEGTLHLLQAAFLRLAIEVQRLTANFRPVVQSTFFGGTTLFFVIHSCAPVLV
jgi:hypothetical protein